MSNRDWVQVFKEFHANPELGFEEVETTNRIKEILNEEGIEIVPTKLSTGLIAVIRGAEQGKSVCLRADIDALPIQEQTELDYSSQKPGVMHACGHDFHTTVGLAAAARVNRLKGQLKGTLYIAFEPGEEAFHGAKRVLETGVLRNVTEVYGFHSDPAMKAGEVGIKEGGVMASVDRFRIDVTGIGTHAATPHLGNNPITVITSVISALQSFAAREVSPTQSRVITFTHMEAGNTWNIIPETAFCEGTVRTLQDKDRNSIRSAFYHIVRSIGEMTGTDCRLEWITGSPAVMNARSLCEAARISADEAGLKQVNFVPEMVSDDFSFFTEQNADTEGLFLKIGTGEGYALHHPKFQVDTAAIAPAVELISNILVKTLSNERED